MKLKNFEDRDPKTSKTEWRKIQKDRYLEWFHKSKTKGWCARVCYADGETLGKESFDTDKYVAIIKAMRNILIR